MSKKVTTQQTILGKNNVQKAMSIKNNGQHAVVIPTKLLNGKGCFAVTGTKVNAFSVR